MNLSAALIGKDATVNIASASYDCALTVRQGSERYTAIHCIRLFPNGGLRGQLMQSVLVFNITHMYAMSDWSDYFPCSCRANIWEPAIWFTESLFSAVFRVQLPSFWISIAMSDTQSTNTSLLDIMISSKNECIFIRDLSDLTLQIIFYAWWASKNVGSKRRIA